MRVCRVLADCLRDCGYRVIKAADANEAVTVISKPDLRLDTTPCDGTARATKRVRPSVKAGAVPKRATVSEQIWRRCPDRRFVPTRA